MPGKALPEPPDATTESRHASGTGLVKIDLAGTITDGQQIESGQYV